MVGALLGAALCFPALATSDAVSDGSARIPVPAPDLCFAPETPQRTIEKHRRTNFWRGLETSLQAQNISRDSYAGDRWTTTATNGSGLQQGDPTTLTWSVIPDGTSIHNHSGRPTETVAPSELKARLNEIYGSQSVWQPIIQGVLDDWGASIGVTYVYETNDDGAAFGQFSLPGGVLGVRGDVRIGGHNIDGNSGVLAYNFYPNTGDMVIDTNDSFYDNTGSNSLGLRNVLAHEHGHGLGLPHVCPVNQTKLMEPFVSFAFDGPQHDDIRAMNRAYGDPHETNDSSGSADALGSVSGQRTLNLSIDDNSDVDWFSVNVGEGASMDVTVTPIGSNYLSGPQNSNGTCSAGSSFDTLNIHELSVEILDQDGTTVLSNTGSGVLGFGVSLLDVLLDSGAGSYYVKVNGGSNNDAQLYRLDLNVTSNDLFADNLESGSLSAWSSTSAKSFFF